jgi:hypothetical protein
MFHFVSFINSIGTISLTRSERLLAPCCNMLDYTIFFVCKYGPSFYLHFSNYIHVYRLPTERIKNQAHHTYYTFIQNTLPKMGN